jgi:hypothetical protein
MARIRIVFRVVFLEIFDRRNDMVFTDDGNQLAKSNRTPIPVKDVKLVFNCLLNIFNPINLSSTELIFSFMKE